MSQEPAPKLPAEIDLEPRLKVRRLNRFAVLLAAAGGILVLWVAYYVLSHRQPVAQAQPQPPRATATSEKAAIEWLERRAALKPLHPPQPERLSPPPPAPERRRAQRPMAASGPTVTREQQRLERAYESDLLVQGFQLSRLESAVVADPSFGSLERLGAGDSPGAVPARRSAGANPDHLERKDAFLRQARELGSRALASAVVPPRSPYELLEGTLIPAILATGIHSDLPGQAVALVRRNVYDTVSGRHLVIPQGSRLIGSYDNRIAWGQKRVLLAWHRLLFPDGRSIDLEGMPGADLAAMAGLRDQVHNHFVRTFGSAILLSAITAGTQLSQPQESADGGAPSARQITAAALGQELGRVTGEITRRNTNIQPTLEIRPGYLFHVEVTADLVLPGPYSAVARFP